MKRPRYEQTSFEKEVFTPSPYSNTNQQTDLSLYTNFLPSSYRNETISTNVFWKDPDEYCKTIFWSIKYIIDRFQDKGAYFSRYMFELPENYNEDFGILDYRGIGLTPYEVDLITAVNYWKNLMKNKKIKIIFIYTISKPVSHRSSHATWTIIDKVRRRVEFFDPHGSFVISTRPNFWSVDWSEKFKQTFLITSSKRDPYRFIPNHYYTSNFVESCPLYGFQAIESEFPQQDIDLKGYCMLWSVFMLELRLSDIGTDIRKVQESVIETMSQTLNRLSRHSSDFNKRLAYAFRNFIRRYSLYMRNEYIKEQEKQLMNQDPYFWLNK